MDKQCRSEIKLSETGKYSVKYGTMNKKNPRVIYIRTKIKVKPSLKKTNYYKEINDIKNGFVKDVKNIIEKEDMFLDEYIVHFDTNERGMLYNKNSYIKYDLYVKPKDVQVFSDYKPCISSLTEKLNEKLSLLIKDTCLIYV